MVLKLLWTRLSFPVRWRTSMGRQADGSVVATPRVRVIDDADAAVFQAILDADPDKFEIIYPDGTIVFGNSIADWLCFKRIK